MLIRDCRRLTLLMAFLLAQFAVAGRAVSQQVGAGTAPDPELPRDISPRGALLRSFAVPGWGQAYAGAPGRGAVYFAMGSGALWMTFKTQRQLSASRERDAWLRETGQLPEQQISGLSRARAQQFEDWITLTVVLFLFSGADAYVVAQLMDVAEQVDVRPSGGGLQIQARLGVGGGR